MDRAEVNCRGVNELAEAIEVLSRIEDVTAASNVKMKMMDGQSLEESPRM